MKECKICKICKICFPKSLEYFYKHPNKTDGLSPYCKKCAKENAKKRNFEKKVEIKEHNLKKKHNNRGVKPPFNYMGNKYYMYDELKLLLPENINTFLDLFCGSGMVGANSNATKIILNDIDKNMIECLKSLYINHEIFLEQILQIEINSKESYEFIKNEFNGNNKPHLFYALIQNSFMQTPVYGASGQVINSYAQGKAFLNEELIKRIGQFGRMLKAKNIEFSSESYEDIDIDRLNSSDFVFIDPPYLSTVATYNSQWSKNDDIKLMKFIDNLNQKGVRFGMTNTINNIDMFNHSKKYNIFELSKSKHKTKNRSKESESANEFYVCNY